MISVSVSLANLWPLAMRALLELEVVFDDAVVHDDEGAGAVAVRVGIFFCGAAVSGPASVANAVGAVDGIVVKDFVEVAEFAGGAAELKGVGRAGVGLSFGDRATGDGDAGGVITAVFEAGEAFHDDGDAGFGADITDNATHSP